MYMIIDLQTLALFCLLMAIMKMIEILSAIYHCCTFCCYLLLYQLPLLPADLVHDTFSLIYSDQSVVEFCQAWLLLYAAASCGRLFLS